MATLDSLKIQRRTIKSACTRIATYINNVKDSHPETIAQVVERKEKLNSHWTDYNAVQAEIEILSEAESADRISFEDSFYTLSGKIRVILDSALTTTAVVQQPVASTSRTSDNAACVKLPKLSLPSFAGQYQDWLPFSNVFTSVIHDNHAITNTQKFQYLQSSLTGDAADIIKSLELSDENYSIAWNLLKSRYDNNRIIVNAHVKEILELPSMIRENAQGLKLLADGANKHIRALKSLKRPVDKWDDILVYILTSKLDSTTAREWQTSLKGNELPSIDQLLNFITKKYQILEVTSKRPCSNQSHANTQSVSSNKRSSMSHIAIVKTKCIYCKGDHPVYICKDFAKLSAQARVKEIKQHRICTNCLRSNSHHAGSCPSGSCKHCGRKHNTLLHLSNTLDTKPSPNDSNNNAKSTAPTANSSVVAHSAINNNFTMLSTALIYATNHCGSEVSIRSLLDCGSQANFISRSCVQALKLPTRAHNISITGINQNTSVTNEVVSLKLRSRINSFTATIECIVIDKITDKLPSVSVSRKEIIIPHNISLADPQFHISSDIDLLIGADLFWQSICIGQIKASTTHPLLQKTHFGWILAGRILGNSGNSHSVKAFHTTISSSDLHKQLSKFWEFDDIPNSSINYSLDEQQCENHFVSNVSQNDDGRLIVKLPIKQNILDSIGDSKTGALRRFYHLERRLNRDPSLKLQYTNFINEYLSLGHMRLISETDDHQSSFYLPHHCVIKSSSQTTKLRVVFDGSFRSSTGVSLNDSLMVGPIVQQDLIAILLRFRTHIYVLTADIVKMYRQVLVHPSQTSLQRILWRENSSKQVDTFELLTVTYGTSSASYLATRCLNYLAELESSNHPLGASYICRDFYVDDLLTGADSVSQLKLIRNEVVKILEKGCFELSKWSTNIPEVLDSTHNSLDSSLIDFNKCGDSRILGIRWNSSTDTFHFIIESYSTYDRVTKRIILSETAKLFDPLGLVSPVTVIPKLLIQELWQSNIDWDSSVPQHIHTEWTQLRKELGLLNNLEISRCVKFSSDPNDLQIHGFSDASQKAYGACIYLRSRDSNGRFKIELVCSKSRIAPLKAISLPRLELCAALLLAQLYHKVKESINTHAFQTFLWTDSTITLNWISSHSKRWVVFVANRVGEIQRLTNISDWHHVLSEDNPADLISRGLPPSKLLNSTIWWHGPSWLQSSEDSWPISTFTTLDDIPEVRKVALIAITSEDSTIYNLINKFSNVNKVSRIVAYCLRFISNCRKDKSRFLSNHIEPDEMERALHCLCKFVQLQAFPQEINALKNGHELSTSSKLLSLSPFLDNDNMLRVGGRLKHSSVSYNQRHPILLPKRNRLTQLIIEREHIKNLHAGIQLTIAAVRQRFWPIQIRSVARGIVRNCVTCFKCKPVTSEALMGQLPSSRVEPARPFSQCGVDYAGPFYVREGRRRNAHKVKSYIAIFVCFSTKAVHIELVGDLSSASFLAALKRFMARRGKVATMHSDNGTAFTGASNELKEFFDMFHQEQTQTKIREFLRESQVQWKFIPPNAPHFGGLWEAAVKSAKFHLHRIVRDASLTFEEMQTVLSEIEAILNSRPITPLSEDPNDLNYLTPGHFLIGDALNSFPYPDLNHINENRLSRWQRVEQIRQHFWQRWSSEYLSQLQEKHKWKSAKGDQLKVGQIVIIKQQGFAPLQWLLGRIQDVHPGADGIIRSATVKTARGTLVRPLTKLCILPMETSHSSTQS